MSMSFSQEHKAVLYGSETACAMIPVVSTAADVAAAAAAAAAPKPTADKSNAASLELDALPAASTTTSLPDVTSAKGGHRSPADSSGPKSPSKAKEPAQGQGQGITGASRRMVRAISRQFTSGRLQEADEATVTHVARKGVAIRHDGDRRAAAIQVNGAGIEVLPPVGKQHPGWHGGGSGPAYAPAVEGAAAGAGASAAFTVGPGTGGSKALGKQGAGKAAAGGEGHDG